MAASGAAAGAVWPLPARAFLSAKQPPGEKVTLPDPIPSHELDLPQIKAEPWLQIDAGNVFLKGLAFDRNHDLLVMAAYAGGSDASRAGRLDRSILRITPNKQISTVVKKHGPRFCDHAIHKDGRIFIACLTGELFSVQPDGSGFTALSARANGKPEELSDLTFDSRGALYVTDFLGKPGNPAGGVYRYSPDFKTVERFGPGLVSPNGIAFTADESALWVTCSFDKKLVKLALSPDRKTVAGIPITYALSGPGGDGIRIDKQENVYVAMNFQGRILIFNSVGKPIGTVLMPGRDRGELLITSNLVFKPGTDEVFAVASGDAGGTWIYRFRGLAEGLPLYSQQ